MSIWVNHRRVGKVSIQEGNFKRRWERKIGKVAMDPDNPFGASDPHFSSVVLLMHMNGDDASTTFTDVKGHSFTAVGNAQIDTAQSKFGGASGLFEGTGDHIETADSDDWTFDGDFTIEGWLRLNGTANAQYIFSHYNTGANFWGVILDFVGGLGFRFLVLSGGSAIIDITQGANTGWSTGTWYHFAVTRSGNDYKLFRDGTQVASGTDVDAIPNFAGLLRIGDLSGAATENFNGWLDDLRITKGVARYTANFTPPTKAFPDK